MSISFVNSEIETSTSTENFEDLNGSWVIEAVESFYIEGLASADNNEDFNLDVNAIDTEFVNKYYSPSIYRFKNDSNYFSHPSQTFPFNFQPCEWSPSLIKDITESSVYSTPLSTKRKFSELRVPSQYLEPSWKTAKSINSLIEQKINVSKFEN